MTDLQLHEIVGSLKAVNNYTGMYSTAQKENWNFYSDHN
jgi:hypothetical protein